MLFRSCEEHPSNNGGTTLVVPFRPTVTTYNILMMACGTNDERAKSVMNEMRRSGLCPDRISWSILMDIYGTSQNRNGAIQVSTEALSSYFLFTLHASPDMPCCDN